jgi:CBS domain-containing protein
VFSVTPQTPLADVARRMAKDKLGSAVVMKDRKVVGIFTATDALFALDFLLTSPSVKHALHEALIPARDAQSERS